MPKLSTHKITKKFVDSLSTDRDAFYFDSALKGFGIRTKPSGLKTYLVQYRNSDQQTRRVSIGQHGVLTPDQARSEAIKLLARIELGDDPANDRLEGRRAMTVRQLCDEYFRCAEKGLILGKRGLPKKVSTLTVDRGRVVRHILPLLGNRKVRDLTTVDINRFVRDVSAGKTALDEKTKARGRAIVRGGHGTAARTVGLLGGILSYAVSEGVIPQNPCRGVRRSPSKRKTVRLNPEQYALLGKALSLAQADGEAWQAVKAIMLLAVTGCRRGEITNLKWSDVDLTSGALRLSDSKTGKSVRPLGKAALQMLESLRNNESYVFPAIKITDAPYSGLPKAWKRVLARLDKTELDKLDGLTPHALRHAFASVANDLGYTEITIAGLIGHATTSVTGRYVHTLDTSLVSAADKVSTQIETYLCIETATQP